jgi:hypothetical protein
MGKRPASVNVQPCSSILLMLVPVAQSCPSLPLPLRQRGGCRPRRARPALGRNVPHLRLRRKKRTLCSPEPRTYVVFPFLVRTVSRTEYYTPPVEVPVFRSVCRSPRQAGDAAAGRRSVPDSFGTFFFSFWEWITPNLFDGNS